MAVRRRSSGGRVVTALLLLVLAGVAGAAIADSLGTSDSVGRRSRRRSVVRAIQLPRRAELATRLRDEHVTGVLYFVDRACKLHALGLPALATAPAPANGGCRALVSPAPAPPGWSLWPRNTPLAARCEQDNVIVTPTVGPSLPMVGGCAPAWSPDGAMTFVRRGAVVQFPRTGRAEVVRSRDELTRAIDRVPACMERRAGARTRWPGSVRAASQCGRGRAVALRPGRLSGQRVIAYRRRIPTTVTELRASPRGRYLVLGTSRGVQVYDARTQRLTPLRGSESPQQSPGRATSAGSPSRGLTVSSSAGPARRSRSPSPRSTWPGPGGSPRRELRARRAARARGARCRGLRRARARPWRRTRCTRATSPRSAPPSRMLTGVRSPCSRTLGARSAASRSARRRPRS